MRNKTLILGLICLFIFAYCKSPADPEIKKIIEQKVNLPIIEYFLATPTSLDYLQKSTLKWKVINANKIEIDNGIGIVGIVGMREITPRETTTYILIATNDDGNTKQSCKVVCKSGNIKLKC